MHVAFQTPSQHFRSFPLCLCSVGATHRVTGPDSAAPALRPSTHLVNIPEQRCLLSAPPAQFAVQDVVQGVTEQCAAQLGAASCRCAMVLWNDCPWSCAGQMSTQIWYAQLHHAPPLYCRAPWAGAANLAGRNLQPGSPRLALRRCAAHAAPLACCAPAPAAPRRRPDPIACCIKQHTCQQPCARCALDRPHGQGPRSAASPARPVAP